MSKPKAAPVGSRIRSGKHAKAVESKDFIDFKRMMGVEPKNRKERRERKKNA